MPINGNVVSMSQRKMVDTIYPIGSIYMSMSSTSPPDVLFGGTWEQIEDTFLLCAGSTYAAGGSGGSSTVTLTTTQVPKVSGTITMHSGAEATNVNTLSGCFSSNLTNDGSYKAGGETVVNETTQSVGVIAFNNGGTGAAHDNMPPYFTVYAWQRVG